MIEDAKKEKAIIARVPYDLWKYVKTTSVEDDTSVSAIVNYCLNKYKTDREKKLTREDKMIK